MFNSNVFFTKKSYNTIFLLILRCNINLLLEDIQSSVEWTLKISIKNINKQTI